MKHLNIARLELLNNKCSFSGTFDFKIFSRKACLKRRLNATAESWKILCYGFTLCCTYVTKLDCIKHKRGNCNDCINLWILTQQRFILTDRSTNNNCRSLLETNFIFFFRLVIEMYVDVKSCLLTYDTSVGCLPLLTRKETYFKCLFLVRVS